MSDTLLIVAAYLIGSLSSAIIVARLMGLPDPRTQGSGNPGATNMMRVGGKKAAAITLAGDLLKGLLPVLVVRVFNTGIETQLLVALAAFLGHLYPVFFGFKGGKGVATAAGVLIGLNPFVAAASLATWVIVFKLKGISSLSALTATALTPLYIYLISGDWRFVLFGLVLALLVTWRHQSNIRNLLSGAET